MSAQQARMFVDNKLSLGFSLLVDQPWPVASLRPSSGAPSRKSAFLQAKPSRKEARRLGKAYSVFGNHESKSGGLVMPMPRGWYERSYQHTFQRREPSGAPGCSIHRLFFSRECLAGAVALAEPTMRAFHAIF